MTFEVILGILLASIFSENIALIECLGTGAVLENERSSRRSLTLGFGTTIVMLISTLITWPLNTYVLTKVPYLQTMVFVLVVLVVVELLHLVARRILDNYCKSDFVKFAINGAVLGICIHNTHLGFLEAVVTSVCVGIAFMLTMTVYAKLKDLPVDEEAIPAPFRGLPIALLTAGMMVLAMMALQFNI
jgi:electron transport complex protein RnfA